MNRLRTEGFALTGPSYLLSAPDEPQLSPERDCNVNTETEGMSVEFGFRDAKRIEPLLFSNFKPELRFFSPFLLSCSCSSSYFPSGLETHLDGV